MKHQPGDTWEYVAPNGDRGRVWLESRDGEHELWQYEFSHKDGSGRRSDWTATRRKAVELCTAYFPCPVFRKVKSN